MSSLYNLSAEVAALKEKLEASDLDAQTIADTLEAESFDFEEKCKAVAYVIKEFEAKEMALSDALEEMELRLHVIKNRIYSLKTYLLTCLQQAGVRKVEGVEFDISIKKNPPSVSVFNQNAIPEMFWKIPEPSPAKLDRKAILESLKKGKTVPGCELSKSERVEIK